MGALVAFEAAVVVSVKPRDVIPAPLTKLPVAVETLPTVGSLLKKAWVVKVEYVDALSPVQVERT